MTVWSAGPQVITDSPADTSHTEDHDLSLTKIRRHFSIDQAPSLESSQSVTKRRVNLVDSCIAGRRQEKR